MDDDGWSCATPQAILVYLAAQVRDRRWYPRDDAALLGEVSQWLAFADAITATASAARLHDGLFYDLDVDTARAGAHRLFRILDEHLWFGERRAATGSARPRTRPSPTSPAFPTSCCREEGGISRQDYPAIRRWGDRVKRVPGFIAMSGIFPAGPARAA